MTRAPQKEWLSTAEMSERTGVTPRQLQWWDERGVLSPEGWRGESARGARGYSVAQVEVVRRIMFLRRAGVSLNELRKLARIPSWTHVVIARAGYAVIGDTLVLLRKPRYAKYGQGATS